MKIISKLVKDQKGMTGLETAIILIAFVTVAAVFGYAVLSAGLFSAEQGKSTIYAGLQEANSNLKVAGSVIAKSADNQNVDKIIFTLVATPSGNPIDLTACDGTSNAHNTCVMSLTTTGSYLNNVKWATKFSDNTSDNTLKPGSQCQVTIDTTDLGTSTLSDNITINSKFSVEVKPAVGATVTIQRTCPAAISGVMDLN